MIAELARKELRTQAPFLFFAVFIVAVDVVDGLVSELPDMRSFKELVGDAPETANLGTALLFVLCFSLALGLLVRDFDERTMEFLDALPLSRSALFAVKVATGYAILASLPLAWAALASVGFALSGTSLHSGVPFGLVLAELALELVQIFVFFAFGVALSFLRRFAWISLGVFYWLYVLALQLEPGIERWNPFLLTRAVFHGRGRLIPWSEVGAALGLAAMALALAHALYVRAGDRWFVQRGGGGDPKRARVAGAAIVLVTSALGISVLTRLFDDVEQKEPGTIRYASYETARAATACYVMVYPENLAARARALAERADGVYARVAGFLGQPATSSAAIAVDATGSAIGTGGAAHGSKVRISLASSEDPDQLAATLGHETTHVFISRLSRARADARADSTRFFHEGLATHLEYALFLPEPERDRLRLISAVMHARRMVRFEDLTDAGALRAKLDPDLVYPLGEAFVAAMVAELGPPAIARVLESLGRESAREDLSGMELWRDTFQAAGYDLDVVVAAFYRTLDAWVARYRARIDAFPRLVGRVSVEDRRVSIGIPALPPPGYDLACRFRARADSEREDYFIISEAGLSECRVPRRALPRVSFGYQLGFIERGTNRWLFEPWVEVRSP